MVKETSPSQYIDDIRRLDQKVRVYFEKRGYFHSTKRIPSYSDIEGKNPVGVPDGYRISEYQFPINNPSLEDTASALDACIKVGRSIFPELENYAVRVLQRSYMLFGSTLPIRIDYEFKKPDHASKIETRKTQFKSVIVKKLDMNIIMGSFLYNLCTNGNAPTYQFNKDTYFVEATPGDLMALVKPEKLMSEPKFRENWIRMAVLAEFMWLNDLDNDGNFIVTPDNSITAIDFNQMFFERNFRPEEKIFNPFRSMSDDKFQGYFSPNEINEVAAEERKSLAVKVTRHIDQLEQIADLMNFCDYYKAMTKQQFKEKTVPKYFKMKLSQFKAATV